jgi:hypothetical protein
MQIDCHNKIVQRRGRTGTRTQKMASTSVINTSTLSTSSSVNNNNNNNAGTLGNNNGHEQSSSSSLLQQETSTSSSFLAESLPDMTVQSYLEKLRDEVEKRIMDHAKLQNDKLWEDFEREKLNILEEAKRTKLTTKSPVKIVIVEVSSRDKDLSKKYEIKVGGDRHLTAKVGRSRGQQFTEGKGISLYWDNEVSTTHGHFLVKNEELMFEDLGSTNKSLVHQGTKQDVVTLTRNQSAVLKQGDVLIIGASKLKILDIKTIET